MNGYDFETLICELLNKMGFSVEQTPLSGDGGIDIIARSRQPIYKGEYLIQCKHWSSPIGEPAVRDLYGAVTARNANKGILITNSTFSDKAIQFSDNKNIELIDGRILNELLQLHSFNEEMPTLETLNFIDMEVFDKAKYLYLTKRIEQDRTNKKAYEAQLHFYLDYTRFSRMELLNAELANEIIIFINEYIGRFCKRTKTLLNEKKALQLLLAHVYMLKGELLTTVELLNDINLFQMDNTYRGNGSTSHIVPIFEAVVSDENGTTINTNFKTLILLNLHQIFAQLEYQEGTIFIENVLMEYAKKDSEEKINPVFLEFESVFKDEIAKERNIELHKRLLEDLKTGNLGKLFFPVIYSSQPKTWSVECDSESQAAPNVYLQGLIDVEKFQSQRELINLNLDLTHKGK